MKSGAPLRFLLTERATALRCLTDRACRLCRGVLLMRVSEFDDFETEGLLSARKQRSWLWFGLIVSIALHLGLCAYFYRTRFQTIDPKWLQAEQTPTFKVRNVDLAPQLDKNSVDQTNPAAKPEPDNTQEQQPDEKKSF